MDLKTVFDDEKVDLLKALAHPIRLCIVRGLIEKGTCNVSYMEKCLDVSQSRVSQHLTKLKNAKIIRGIRRGNEINYEISNQKVKKIIAILDKEDDR